MVSTPEEKLTWPGLRTKECCHEHAGEIFRDLPGLLLTAMRNLIKLNAIHALEVHFQVKRLLLDTPLLTNQRFQQIIQLVL